MKGAMASSSLDHTPTHLILYDGLCGLCNRLNQFVLRRDRAGDFKFASQQSHFGQSVLLGYGKNREELDTLYVIADYGEASARLLSKSSAALFILGELGAPRRLAFVLRIFPRRLLDWAYDIVARNRYRILGRYDSCPPPGPNQRSRFLDVP